MVNLCKYFERVMVYDFALVESSIFLCIFALSLNTFIFWQLSFILI